MVVQSKNNVSASVLPDLSDDSKVEAPEKKEPVAVVEPVETPTPLEPVASTSVSAPAPTSKTLANKVVTETIEELVVAEDLDVPVKVASSLPASESVPESVSTAQASVIPEVSPVETAETQQSSQELQTEIPQAEASPAKEREEIPLEKKNAKLYKIGTVLLVLILISTAGVFYMRTKTTTISTKVDEPVASSTPAPESTPEPTPEIITLERDEITLEILNGTSTSGLAGKTASIFEELGYEIGDVGNADDSTENKLYVKTEFADQLENLLEDVKDELNITEIAKQVDDLDVTARIILGGE